MTTQRRSYHERRTGSVRWGPRAVRLLPLFAFVTAVAIQACGGDEAARSDEDGEAPETTRETAVHAAGEGEGKGAVRIEATDRDWEILSEKVTWARENGLDTLPVGEAVGRLARTFVGTPYVPHTLEVEGPERLVVNLRALDCVTFVETVLATVHLVRGAAGEVDPHERDALARAYRKVLTRIRYRSGELEGYPSRLHYFSEWIRDGQEKGIVRDVTAELGGVPDAEPVSFMTSHPDAYRQLADPDNRAELERIEERISRTPRIYLPQEWIDRAAPEIREGDVIAATSTEEGLDVAHTGLAVRHEGRLHLLHAPLVGDSVQLSERTLARRINENEGQDGILVARPLLPEPVQGATDPAVRER